MKSQLLWLQQHFYQYISINLYHWWGVISSTRVEILGEFGGSRCEIKSAAANISCTHVNEMGVVFMYRFASSFAQTFFYFFLQMKIDFKFSNLCGTVYKKGNLIFTPDGNSLISPVGNRVSVYDLVG